VGAAPELLVGAITMLSFLEQLVQARHIQDIWSLYAARMEEHGFDRLLYGLTRFRTPKSLGDLADTLMLSTHDKSYTDAFVWGGAYQQAPMVTWAAENEGACSWRIVEERARAGQITDAEMSVLQLNQKYGVVAGYSISFPAMSMRQKGAMGLCARPGLKQADVDVIWQENGREIMVLSTLVHLRISTMPHATARRPLTTRQREVLEWVGEGKTTADIAVIMGLTPATVEKHLRLAREALDVDTTAQAVLKASVQNQIFLTGE
jgi:DNA-binding CsgD family transcriptional regulator